MKTAALAIFCLAAASVAAQELVLTVTGPTTVYEGQLIPVEVDLRGTVPFPVAFADFRLEPPQACANGSPSCYPTDMWTSRRSDRFLVFGGGSPSVATDLNSHIPALKPGKYRVRAVIAKQGLPKVEILSKPVTIQIIPATAAWLRRTIEASRRAEDVKQLGFLYVTQAFDAGLEGYARTGMRDYLFGLYRNPNEGQSCEILRTTLRNSAGKITSDYIWLTANVCRRAKLPFPAELKSAKDTDPRRIEWIHATAAYELEITLEAIKLLASRAGDKGANVAERAQVLRYTSTWLMDHAEPIPNFAKPALAATLRDLPGYSPSETSATLSEIWYLVGGLEIRAVLEAVLRHDPFDREWIEARRIALRLLCYADPSAGHDALLAELRHFRPTLDESLTKLLPAATVPPMDGALIAHLARAQSGQIQHPAADPFLLIALYLSPRSQEPMRRIYESQSSPCQPEITAYFLRVQPAYAEQMLKRVTTGMHAAPGPCTMNYINRIPRLIMTPVLESYLIAHLQHENVYVKADSARLLSGFGTSAAKQPLWDSYIYFHEYWKGKEAQLNNPDYLDGRILEDRLRTSIARGRAWLTTEAELRRFAAMCVGERCKADSVDDLRIATEKPIPMELSLNPLETEARIAQYAWFQGMDAIKTKLAQFPAGTRFQIRVSGQAPRSERDRIIKEFQSFGRSKALHFNSN